MNTIKLENMLKEGFSKKFAKYYLNLAEKEMKNVAYDQSYVSWAHSVGFLAESAYAYGLKETNYHAYLSDYDYYKIWPINNWTRLWINDKLTLKYMLADTKFNDFMPKYYFYSTPKGLVSLINNPGGGDINAFIKLLIEKKEFACKPCNGSTSLGFYKLSIIDNSFFLNDKEIKKADIEIFINEHPNYIFTEYIKPTGYFRELSPNIHTLRLVTVNENGKNPVIIGGYLRVPNKMSGAANYIILGEHNREKYNLFIGLDVQTGILKNSKLVYENHIENTNIHPDSKIKICGQIDEYKNLKQTVLSIADRFNTIEYMGFDIGITEYGFKCMEINSHPGIKYMQIFQSLYDDEFTKQYFLSKINAVNLLDERERIIRNNIIR